MKIAYPRANPITKNSVNIMPVMYAIISGYSVVSNKVPKPLISTRANVVSIRGTAS